MKYTTGELAEMFGLTNEGVRYMEGRHHPCRARSEKRIPAL